MSEIPPTRRGFDAREVVSALQKSIRRSDPDAAIYWGLELARSGFGAWLWKRLRIIVCEDVSPTATGLVADVHALNQMWEAEQKRRRGDGLLYVARALIALAIAPKNRVADYGLMWHLGDHVERREVPDFALDVHTARGRAMGRGWQHFAEVAGVLEPWAGDLEQLSAHYRDRWLKAGGDAATAPEPVDEAGSVRAHGRDPQQELKIEPEGTDR
jgi:hypothetical protein